MTFVFKHPFIISIAVGLIVLALWLAWRKHTQLVTGRVTQGEVTELIPKTDSDGDTLYTTRVAYLEANGTRAEFITKFATKPAMHTKGEKVRVICYPAPREPDILAFNDLFLFPWILFCIGATILLFCAGFALGPDLVNAFYGKSALPVNPLKPIIQ